MKHLFTLLLFTLLASFNKIDGQTVIISQYIETSSGSTPKGIEIWNPTGISIDFSSTNLEILQGTNGGTLTEITTISTGVLSAGGLLVIGTNDMDTQADLPNPCTSNVLYVSFTFTFNGDDALALRLDGNITDIFGTPGTDPGTNWNGGGVSTFNSNIELVDNITTGDLDGWSNPSERFQQVSTNNTLNNFGVPPTGCLLPIELIYFNVSKNKNNSILSYSTASETNNAFFTIERSADGTSFDAIGEIKGAGNSNTTLSYEFTDEKPFAGANYYRIKQTDYDGKFSYTDIKSVRHNTYGNLNITPRTTEGRLQITTDAEDYTLDVYNVAGQKVKSYPSLSLDQSISIDELTAGLYYIKVNVGGQVETTKIVKL